MCCPVHATIARPPQQRTRSWRADPIAAAIARRRRAVATTNFLRKDLRN
jgi:hypothetical protein